MRNKKKYFLLVLILFSLAFSACRSNKTIANTDKSVMKLSEEDIQKQKRIDALPSANFDFNFLQAKAKVQANVKEKNYNLTFNIRMQKDKIIWISVNAIGSIEVARILMNPDSVRIIDRMNNQYLVKDFDFLSDMLNVPVDFYQVQNMILGNAPTFNNTPMLVYKESDASFQLSENKNGVDYLHTFRSQDNKLSVYNLKENSESQRSIRVEYGDFKSVDGLLFPFLINSIASSQKESLKLDVQYTKLERLNNLEFPFNVPKRFE